MQSLSPIDRLGCFMLILPPACCKALACVLVIDLRSQSEWWSNSFGGLGDQAASASLPKPRDCRERQACQRTSVCRDMSCTEVCLEKGTAPRCSSVPEMSTNAPPLLALARDAQRTTHDARPSHNAQGAASCRVMAGDNRAALESTSATVASWRALLLPIHRPH
jgi:hypothetical protein